MAYLKSVDRSPGKVQLKQQPSRKNSGQQHLNTCESHYIRKSKAGPISAGEPSEVLVLFKQPG